MLCYVCCNSVLFFTLNIENNKLKNNIQYYSYILILHTHYNAGVVVDRLRRSLRLWGL